MATKVVTYTHVGGQTTVGYRHTSALGMHREPTAGKRHALNVSGNGYLAVCGEGVPCDDEHGDRNLICKASDGTVTCKRCLKMRPVVAAPVEHREYVVMYATADGAVEAWRASRLRAEVIGRDGAIADERSLRSRCGAVRVWVEERTTVGV